MNRDKPHFKYNKQYDQWWCLVYFSGEHRRRLWFADDTLASCWDKYDRIMNRSTE